MSAPFCTVIAQWRRGARREVITALTQNREVEVIAAFCPVMLWRDSGAGFFRSGNLNALYQFD